MMIDFALDAERSEGKPPREAIYQACLLRFRPIMMTTMAALLGGVPLALGTGTGSELRRPLGITIVGGLIFSQMLTLYTTPVIYLAFDRLARRVAGRARRRPALSAPGGQREGRVSVSAPFIQRPVGTTLLMVAIALAGSVGYLLLPGRAAARRSSFRRSRFPRPCPGPVRRRWPRRWRRRSSGSSVGSRASPR